MWGIAHAKSCCCKDWAGRGWSNGTSSSGVGRVASRWQNERRQAAVGENRIEGVPGGIDLLTHDFYMGQGTMADNIRLGIICLRALASVITV